MNRLYYTQYMGYKKIMKYFQEKNISYQQRGNVIAFVCFSMPFQKLTKLKKNETKNETFYDNICNGPFLTKIYIMKFIIYESLFTIVYLTKHFDEYSHQWWANTHLFVNHILTKKRQN